MIEGDDDAIWSDHCFLADRDTGRAPVEQPVVRDIASLPDGYDALEIDVSGDEAGFGERIAPLAPIPDA